MKFSLKDKEIINSKLNTEKVMIVLLHLLVTIYIVYIFDMTSHQIAHAADKKNVRKNSRA